MTTKKQGRKVKTPPVQADQSGIARIEMVSVDLLLLDPQNVRKHNERNLDSIKSSLVRFGQQKPIIIDGDMKVVAGNGTLQAAKSLGWDEIASVKTNLVGNEAIAFAIADNRTAELAEWNAGALVGVLKQLQVDGNGLESVNFSEADIKDLVEMQAQEEAERDTEKQDAIYQAFEKQFTDEADLPEHGSVWKIGKSILVVASPTTELYLWRGYFTDAIDRLVIFPSPLVFETKSFKDKQCLLIQPIRDAAATMLEVAKNLGIKISRV